MDLNYFGTSKMVRFFGQKMTKGHICVVNTACGYCMIPGYVGYTASKFA